MAKHLAVFSKGYIKQILSGEKTIEGRFSKIKMSPYGDVGNGDLVYMKDSGEGIVGQFLVSKVISWDHLSVEDLNEIKLKYGKGLNLPATFWKNYEAINYVTLVFIGNVSKFLVPPVIAKKDRRGWVKLSDS